MAGKQKIKATVGENVEDLVDTETINVIDEDKLEEPTFGETLGSVPEEIPEEPKDELNEEPVKETEKEEIVKDETKETVKDEVKQEVVEKEPVIAKEPKESEDELEKQIRAAIEDALPKEEVKKEEDYKDRFFQTQQYATQKNQENINLRQNITTVEAQLAEAARQLKDAGIEITPRQQYQPPVQYTPPTQYQPQVQQQPQIDPRLDASLTSAESKFTPAVVDDYLHPQNGKFHKMVAQGNPAEIFQKVNVSLDPLVEAINLTKEWEQGQEKKVAEGAEDRGTFIDSIVAKVYKQIGVGGQPVNGGKSKLPTNLNDVRADSNLATKITKADAEEEKETFGEHLG